MEAVPDKQQAHELIERLPTSQIAIAVRFLEFMLLDPVSRAIATAPADDEPLTDEERQALARSEAWFRERGGKGHSHGGSARRRRLDHGRFPLQSGTAWHLGSIGPKEPALMFAASD
jgi:hypothetical protein